MINTSGTESTTTPEKTPQFAPAMVPAKMHLDASAMRDLQFILGSADDGEPFMDGVLWVGKMPGDNGESYYGLHVYSSEYPEEGSITLATFDPADCTPEPIDQEAKDFEAIGRAYMSAFDTVLSEGSEWDGYTPAECPSELLMDIFAAQQEAKSPQPVHGQPFQDRVKPWMLACFGEEISNDKLERCDRFIEEALELVQAIGYSATRAHALVEYVFHRDIGEPHQEVGGVMVTLAALCLASGLDMNKAGEDELTRIWTKVEKIRAKQAAKPTGSALPIASPSITGATE